MDNSISTSDIVKAVQTAPHSKIREALAQFLGKPGVCDEVQFNHIPTDKLKIETSNEGLITRIRYWYGLKWTPQGGYGSPSVEVELALDY